MEWDILDRIEEKMELLKEPCADLSIDELYEQARMEHLWALGSHDNDEALEHEITSDAYRLLAREKEKAQMKEKLRKEA